MAHPQGRISWNKCEYKRMNLRWVKEVGPQPQSDSEWLRDNFCLSSKLSFGGSVKNFQNYHNKSYKTQCAKVRQKKSFDFRRVLAFKKWFKKTFINSQKRLHVNSISKYLHDIEKPIVRVFIHHHSPPESRS